MGKIYAKEYQALFKIGMYIIPWGMPETLEGAGCVTKLPALIREKGFEKVLVVTRQRADGAGAPGQHVQSDG